MNDQIESPNHKVAAIVATISGNLWVRRPSDLAALQRGECDPHIEEVVNCIRSLLANTYATFEVIVVDQSPHSDIGDALTNLIGVDSRLRYLRTPLPGKSRALNLAIRKSDATIFAFTDDDCLVPADWLTRIVDSFVRLPDAGLLFGDVFCPTGHDWETSFVPAISFGRERRLPPTFLPRVNNLLGANMAVRREVFRRVGLFDVRLGPGGLLGVVNEEVDLHLRALRARPSIPVYLTPSFHVVHEYGQRPLGDPARQLLRLYQMGKAAMLTKHARRGDPGAVIALLAYGFEPFVRGAINLMRTGRPRGVGQIIPYLIGIKRSWITTRDTRR